MSRRDDKGRRPKRSWLDRVSDDIRKKGLSGQEVCDTIMLHGGVCHRTSTPYKSGNTMKEKTAIETSQTMERRPGQILERHDLVEDSARHDNLEVAC